MFEEKQTAYQDEGPDMRNEMLSDSRMSLYDKKTTF